MISTIEQFQGDLGKKIVNVPKHHANLVPLVALQWPTMRLQILHWMLGFFWHLLHPKKRSICVEAFESLREKNVVPLVVQQCKLLKQPMWPTTLSKHYTITMGRWFWVSQLTVCEEDIERKRLWLYIWKQASCHESLTALSPHINWLKLWDGARDYGIQGVRRALASALCTITIPIFIIREEFSCYILCGHRFLKGHLPAEYILEAHFDCDLEYLLEFHVKKLSQWLLPSFHTGSSYAFI